MRKVAIIIAILLVLAGGSYFGYQKLKSIFGLGDSVTDENGLKFTELKKLPDGVIVNFKVADSCEKPGHNAIRFSIKGMQSAKIKQFEYTFTYVDENKGSVQGNGSTMPIEVKKDEYKPMTKNCNELGLFSCSAGGKCVFYKVSEIEGTYKFYFENGELGAFKEKYKV